MGESVYNPAKRYVLAIGAGLLSAIAFTAVRAQVPVISVRPPQLREVIRESVNTAGNSIIGVTGESLGKGVRTTELVISGLKKDDTVLCVGIEQSSGLYSANFIVPVPSGKPTLRVKIESAQLASLRFRTGEFAIHARAGRGACKQADPILPAKWFEQSTGTRRLTLLVNGQGADAVFLQAESGVKTRPIRCGDLRSALGASASTRSFDRACQIEVPVCGQVATYSLYRRFSGNLRAPQSFDIQGWC
ncbi:hypothetical protein [Novosphingobium sp.]|uniref:hypothetical protein n=1 Tax=Novosphingobium sp. TaxID=1874826 RepID=UPI0025E22348|nr:hypothetical protein [Novosphingobium sp.]MCC6926957.1 hypothetical protein [Novosphingobium sp.]